MDVRGRIKKAMPWLFDPTATSFFYEPIRTQRSREDGREYLWPDFSKRYYRERLDAQLAAVLSPSSKIIDRRYDLFTEQATDRVVWRLTATYTVPPS